MRVFPENKYANFQNGVKKSMKMSIKRQMSMKIAPVFCLSRQKKRSLIFEPWLLRQPVGLPM